MPKATSGLSMSLRAAMVLVAAVRILAGAQTGSSPYSVYGRVTLPDGSPASRVQVRVERQGGVSRQTVTDASGRFEVPDLPRGRYYVTADNPADPDQFAEPVEAETGRTPGFRIQANVYLRYRSKAVSTAASRGGAISVAEQIQSVPKAAQRSFDRAIRMRNDKQLEKSLESFGRAIAEFPGYFQAFGERGHLRIAMGQLSEASADFAKALALNPSYGRALLGAGMCSFQQGKFQEAAGHLQKAVEVDPGTATSYLFLGVAELALERSDQARSALQKALTIDPSGSARAHVYLANLCIKENKPQEALAELEAYFRAVPNPPDGDKLRALASQLRTQVK